MRHRAALAMRSPDLRADALDGGELGSDVGGDAVQSLGDQRQLLVQVQDALREFAEREPGHGLQAVVGGLDAEGGAGRQQLGSVQWLEPSSKVFWCGDE